MTEREEREKTKIEKVLSDEQIKIANTVGEFAKLQKVGIIKCYADALYNAGYRKADEVRKERTKKIFSRIFDKDLCGDLGEFCDEGWVFTVDEAKKIAAEFGVEVGE